MACCGGGGGGYSNIFLSLVQVIYLYLHLHVVAHINTTKFYIISRSNKAAARRVAAAAEVVRKCSEPLILPK